MRKTFRSLCRWTLLFLLGIYSVNSLAINNVLDQINVQESRDQSVIKVVFTERLTYRSHTPKNSGDLVQIDMNFQGKPSALTFENEFLPWRPNKTIPLFEVDLEWKNTAQADLVFRFNRQVKFDVQPSSDSYSITITLYHPQKEQPKLSPELVDTIAPLPSYQKNAANELFAKLMEEARQAMAKEDYVTAIRLYTKVLGSDQSTFAKQALEYLGVAREKRKQLAHAKKLYERYLKRYPKGEDAERVRQRLLAMITASDAPRGKLRARSSKERTAFDVGYYGGFSQSYNRAKSITDVAGDRTTQSELRSDLNLTTRLRSQNFDLSARFTGGHTADFLTDGPGDIKRISSLYFDAKDKVRGASLRLGRQSRTTGGVLGRFDGLYGNYHLTEKVKLNLVAGYPVDSSKDVFITSERYFYGLSFDIGTINTAWDFNLFVINQINDGITDRRAVGGEIRYFDPVKSFFTLVDYDYFYGSLNMFIFNGRWSLSEKTMLNVNYDYRNSPILTTRNALTGQSITRLEQLLKIFPEETINDLAEDRTAKSETLFMGVTHRYSKHFQAGVDVRLSKLSDTISSGGVLAAVGTDLEKEYSFQLTGSSLLKEGDLVLLTTTYSDLTSSNVTTISLNTRYPVTRKLRINPKFKVRYRDNHIDNSNQVIYTPSLQLTYRVRRNFQLEAEVSADFEERKLAGETEHNRDYFFLLGYRYDF
jgi:tetratricopeptide (TPR) repeat protein